MKLSRDNWLGVGILVSLVLIIVFTGVKQSNQATIPYLSTSTAPDGALALELWLDELGYQPAASPLTSFDPEANTKAIFILQPLLEITKSEWKLLDPWIEKGGILIVAGQNGQTDAAFEHFDFSLVYLAEPAVELTASVPLLTSPVLTSKIKTQASYGLQTKRTDFLALASAGGYPLIASLAQGSGMVILSSTPYPFSNIALKDDADASLVLNLIAHTPAGQRISFDEWHHGIQSKSVVGPSQWLQHTPAGHAILFVVGVIFVTLLLQGRAFGRPIPLVHEIKRRSPLEHVTAIANLNRKAEHKNEVLKQYHQRVKRHLGARYRIDPSISDAEYVNVLFHYNSSIDKDALLNLLKRLSQKNVSESDLLKLASEAARWINN